MFTFDMTRPTKCQRQAKQQRASKVKAFDSGFIQDLLDVALDPDYWPESDVEHPNSSDTDSESLASNVLSFSLMDNSNIASEDDVGDSDDDEASDAEITCIGVSKRQQTGSHEFTNTVADDYVERCAGQAWMGIHDTVSIVNVQLREMNDLELTCSQHERIPPLQ
jgi:hypothetical protein